MNRYVMNGSTINCQLLVAVGFPNRAYMQNLTAACKDETMAIYSVPKAMHTHTVITYHK